MGKLIVVAGAQYGSEGKGAVSDHLTRPERVGSNVLAVRVAGPNAGHTVYGMCPDSCQPDDAHMFNGEWIGHPWRLRAVPVSAVSNPDANLAIAAGSEIDKSVLSAEVAALDEAGYGVTNRLRIDSQATLLEPRHIQQEVDAEIQKRLGSTAKGIGAARADRVWRTAQIWEHGFNIAAQIKDALISDATVLIEGTQGFGLGLHAGSYPFCTSSDARAVDFLAMAGVSPWASYVDEFEVWLAARVRPIRVAGNSGPLVGETTWDALGLPTEYTTVTQKVRRVGEWDSALVRQAVHANGGPPVVRMALTMADTLWPELSSANGTWNENLSVDTGRAGGAIFMMEAAVGASVEFVGTGPTTGLFVE